MTDSARRRTTRIQREKTETILEAALDVFSAHGFRGATLDLIADAAGLSKPNLLYYFDSKDAIHKELLERLLDDWLNPLRALNPDGNAQEEIAAYIRRKLALSRERPRESRLFANEALQGAPRMQGTMAGSLKALVDDKARVLRGWMAEGQIADVDPYHLIFSLWAVTQHYADFEVQVMSVLPDRESDPIDDAAEFLIALYTRGLTPSAE